MDALRPLQQHLDVVRSLERNMDALHKRYEHERRQAKLTETQFQQLIESIQPPALDSTLQAIARELQAPKDLLLQTSAAAQLAEMVNRRSAEAWSQIQKAVYAVPRLPDVQIMRERLGLDTLDGRMRALRDSFDRDWRAAWPAGMESLVGSMAEAAAALRSFQIEGDGEELTVDGVRIDLQELEDFLAGEEDLRGIDLETLARLVRQQRIPKKKAWYVYLLIFLLNQLVAFWINVAANRSSFSERPSEQKSIAQALRKATEQLASRAVEDGIPRQLIERYRLVTADTLIVRTKPARDSQRLGELHLGEVVLSVRRAKRSWTLVEWTPAGEDARIQGWVFSRYLKKLRLPTTAATAVTDELETDLEFVACH